jgi:hypothetical protein
VISHYPHLLMNDVIESGCPAMNMGSVAAVAAAGITFGMFLLFSKQFHGNL